MKNTLRTYKIELTVNELIELRTLLRREKSRALGIEETLLKDGLNRMAFDYSETAERMDALLDASGVDVEFFDRPIEPTGAERDAIYFALLDAREEEREKYKKVFLPAPPAPPRIALPVSPPVKKITVKIPSLEGAKA